MQFQLVVSQIGRGTIEYHSEQQRHTPFGELRPSVGGEDGSPFMALMRQQWVLRRAIQACRQRGLGLWGRLSMNRHYGMGSSIGSAPPASAAPIRAFSKGTALAKSTPPGCVTPSTRCVRSPWKSSSKSNNWASTGSFSTFAGNPQ
jgi:hypothetical protein